MNRYILLAIILLLSPIFAIAEEDLKGKVIWVTDGDTIGLLIEGNEKVKIRFNGIDAPESSQDYGNKAKQALSKQIHGKQVRVKVASKDQYGRSLGTVFLGKENINLWLVANGYAWHYKRYSDDKTLAKAEDKARGEKLGLWSMPKPKAPWQYRQEKRDKAGK